MWEGRNKKLTDIEKIQKVQAARRKNERKMLEWRKRKVRLKGTHESKNLAKGRMRK